jgi:hypothetical protein
VVDISEDDCTRQTVVGEAGEGQIAEWPLLAQSPQALGYFRTMTANLLPI